MRVLQQLIYYGLRPALVAGALAYWLADPDDGNRLLVSIFAAQIILGALERLTPARPDWLPTVARQARNAGLVLVLLILTGAVVALYDELLRTPLAEARMTLGLDGLWPHQAPLLVQVFMVFFCSEFIWYWMHRAEHRFALIWRISGHGAHHSFKNLGALNFGLNHPLELFFITLPAALVELFFGVGIAAAGAAALGVVQTGVVHANVRLNTRVVGWLFTTNRYHVHHHSMVLAESNTNYGCAAIVWDRVFGTFADAATQETGTRPTEPTLAQQFLMPIREPDDTAVAP
ncbi:MAG: sterol desaturase family protein [Pseudomonadota bacterium]